MSDLCVAYTFKFHLRTEQRMTPVHLTNELRTITGDTQDKTDMHRTTNGYSCSLPTFQRMLTDKPHTIGHETNVPNIERTLNEYWLTSPDNKNSYPFHVRRFNPVKCDRGLRSSSVKIIFESVIGWDYC